MRHSYTCWELDVEDLNHIEHEVGFILQSKHIERIQCLARLGCSIPEIIFTLLREIS